MKQINEKYERLKEILRGYGRLAVAFSNGVDSTFLLKAAHDVLGDDVLAITAASVLFPGRELDGAKDFCRENGIRQEIIYADELQIEAFRSNPPNRCYICKKDLFGKILALAAENGIEYVAEGSNIDDNGDYRPGMQAISELGIKSPLREAGLYKEEIRTLSKELGLPTWSKPSFACLASRFVYGETISEKKLGMVDQAEQFLMGLGLKQMRVRIHGNLARIEVLPEDLQQLTGPEIREELYSRFQKIGFDYVTLDLRGYRTGSMNETLKEEEV